jgi:1-acyl-sn-glycerol-3-phosphate acyltransferase
MLDLQRLHHIDLSSEPLGQQAVAWGFLAPNYLFFPGVDITLRGTEHLLDEPVIYAMNHTDRFNYWPFQFQLLREAGRYTATWVKGKYYQNPAVGKFMEWTNNIPTVSRGYLIARDFKNVLERAPSDREYRLLRALIDASAYGRASERPSEAELASIPPAIFEQRRNMLGLIYNPDRHDYAGRLNDLFQAMMERFVELNGEALQCGLDLLVFPQGTRSKRLSKGRIGLAQIALYYKRPIVPVGCNGSDEVYPGNSPVAQSGRIEYRIGEPITLEQMEPWFLEEDFQPFTPEAEAKHRPHFQSFVDAVMNRINGLLDPEYQFDEQAQSDGVQGTSRFV